MRVFLLSTVLCLNVAFPYAVMGNDYVLDRIATLERQLNDLEKQVYSGASPSPTPAASQVPFTPRTEVRLQEMEERVRMLTGKMEEMQFQVRALTTQFNDFSQVTQHRMEMLENRPATAQNVPVVPAVVAEPSHPDTPASLQGDRSHILGTIPIVEKPKPPTSQPAVTSITVAIEIEYHSAYSFIEEKKYEEAAKALQSFIDKYPKHELSSNAYYWLGESYYARADYEKASVIFLKGYESFPSGRKAADSLLKLSISLSQLNRKEQACKVLDKLFVSHPDITESLRTLAQQHRTELACR